jgi:AraC-like DNA-binding protein
MKEPTDEVMAIRFALQEACRALDLIGAAECFEQLRAVADRVGVSSKQLLAEAMAAHPSSKGRPAQPLDVKAAIRRHSQGESWQDIARSLGMSRQQLHNRVVMARAVALPLDEQIARLNELLKGTT